jgi:HAMP domain-containing protein
MFSGLVIINIIGLLTLIGLLLLLRIKNSEFKRKIEENISRMAELKYQIENYKMSDEIDKKRGTAIHDIHRAKEELIKRVKIIETEIKRLLDEKK